MKWLTKADKTALICGSRSIHYSELMERIAAGAVMLAGIEREARVAILGANSPEWVIAMYSIWHVHAIAVPIDFMSTPDDIAYILDDCTPVAVWCDTGCQEKLDAALKIAKHGALKRLSLDELGKAAAAPFGDDLGTSDDSETAFIIYTSGTTGSPKGVMLTFGNLLANTTAVSTQSGVYNSEDRVLVVLPLHHAYPLMGSVVMPISIGATSVFAQAMNANAILSALQEGKCTFIIGVPRLLELFRNSMMRKIEQSFLAKLLFKICGAVKSVRFSRMVFKKVQDAFGGHIRYISCGGAASDPQVIRDFYTLGFEVLDGYGMTETAPMISFTPPGGCRPGSPGKPIGCNVVRIKDAGNGEDGEVLVRGDNVMKGYYNRPEETAEVLDADGWLHTGDLGYVDEDGYLFLTGRSKELIILGNGKNIIPHKLEYKLMEMGNGLMTECAVSDDGKHLVAVVVPDMEAVAARSIVNIRQTIMDEIIEPYNEKVPSYERISNLILQSTALPRTRLGKLRRHIIRKSLRDEGRPAAPAEERKTTAPTSKTYRHLAASIEKVAGRAIEPDEHLELDIGLDSLGKLTLLSSLNSEWQLNVPVEMLAKYPTPRTLAQAIDQNGLSSASGSSSPVADMPYASCTHGFIRMVTTAFLKCISHVKIEGTENIPESACVFAPNHQSSLDAFYIIGGLDSRRYHDTLFYIISKFIEGAWVRRFAHRHNLVPMEINGDIRNSIAVFQKALNDGKSILMFPEGTRSMDGSLGDFRPTFAFLAIEAGLPIVPIVVDGAFNVLPRSSKIPSLGHSVTISFLPPVMPKSEDTPADLTEKVRNLIQEKLSRKA